MTIKSPFYVVEEFISPLLCEDIIDRMGTNLPNTDEKGNPLKTVLFNRLTEIRVVPKITELVPKLEAYYGFEYLGLQQFEFEWYPCGFNSVAPICENSNLLENRWIRTNDRDFVGVIFLNDYRDKPPFDPLYEVSGGKLGFPNHGFSFVPKRGQLIVYPGTQHFINATSKVVHGDLHQIKFYITAQEDYEYDPKNFPGTFKEWF